MENIVKCCWVMGVDWWRKANRFISVNEQCFWGSTMVAVDLFGDFQDLVMLVSLVMSSGLQTLCLTMTWYSMKQSIWENGCRRWCIIRIYLFSIIYDLRVAQYALETSSFLMMYWVLFYLFFLLYTRTSQNNGRYNWNLLSDHMFQSTCR